MKSTDILGWRSVCFVRCHPRKNLSQGPFLAAVALFMIYLSLKMLGGE
jgi:hypothetical protein